VVRKLSSRFHHGGGDRHGAETRSDRAIAAPVRHQEQRDYWLPRSPTGASSPASASRSPEAGSDAASMVDTGISSPRQFPRRRRARHQTQLAKTHITWTDRDGAGLPSKLHDPDHLIGAAGRLGITSLGATTCPASKSAAAIAFMQVFRTPQPSHNVFIPLDTSSRGSNRPAKAGRCYERARRRAASRCRRSRPPAAAYSAQPPAPMRASASSFTADRALRGDPERLAACDDRVSARRGAPALPARIDQSHHPAVRDRHHEKARRPSACASFNDAMDVPWRQAVIEGPQNYLRHAYRAVPVASRSRAQTS